ncbi:glutathione S-transferase N-terminal domain-containing protein [Vreelandella jeotgali]|uniref:glutathione S-transferase N-terminal domain-containing protein n=1 Tax=Vreelandella jeotgali TaxID=553386 RepID=UPI000348BA74|nr:glutathione S-transferase N-terminal domain-containing protein [Halomonas jeotgali]
MARLLYELCGIEDALRFSPFCWRIRYALAHKGLEVKTRPWRFTEKEALAFAHHDKVPVLVDGDEVVTDSYDIMRYLDHHYPEASLLGEGMTEARARFFKHYAERALAPSIMQIIMMDLFSAIHPADRAYFRENREKRLGCTLEAFHSPARGVGQLDAALEPLRGQLKASPFLDGQAPAGADYLVFGHFMWARCASNADLIAETDPVHGWQERMLDRHGGLGRNARRISDVGAA